ncbi:MAG: T9SS type A sorting domain-containing protein [Bacteroidota bacterium]
MMNVKTLTLWLGVWLSVSALHSQPLSQCPLSFHPVLEVSNHGSHLQRLGEMFFVLDKTRFDLPRENIVFVPGHSVQLVLPLMELEPGMHILEVYLSDPQTNDLLEKGIHTQFAPVQTLPTHNLSEAAVLENDNPLTKDPSTCACQSHQARHVPAATLWLYHILDATNEPILLISRNNGQKWDQAAATMGQDACPVFLSDQLNVESVASSIHTEIPPAPSFEMAFKAKPNPFSEILYLQFPMIETGEANVNIYNAEGQQVYQNLVTIDHIGPQTLEVSVGDWAAGNYIVLIQTPDQTWKKKLIHVR